jgi:dihydrofolate reductase
MKLIIACDPSGGIGYKNKLPWSKIQGDLPRFKKLTTGKIVLMGRNTWDSLSVKPLPNRVNYVMSSRPINGIVTPETSLILQEKQEVWLIGGAKMIDSYWQYIDEIHLTKVFDHYTCDTFIDLLRLQNNFYMISQENFSDHYYQIWKRDETIPRSIE